MQEKSKFLSVRLTAEEREHLDRLARESGLSLSNVIRSCINRTEIRRHRHPTRRKRGAVPAAAGVPAHGKGRGSVMAVTKILARKGRLDVGVRYVLNGDKTEEQILTASQGCSTEHAVSRMMKTKRHYRQTDGVQYYHIIQSFKPGEATPELALEIAKEFAAEHLSGYQAVIGVHVDKEHIHAHTIFNSVNADTGEKYHSNARSYYSQIRAISDRLCREHGLSIIMEGKGEKAVSYIEWLRQSKGQPTFRAMLEADLREAIEDANDIGHFFLIMEHKGYEIKHGNRLSFRLKGQERLMIPGRKNPLFTEDGIRAAIEGNLDEIAAGARPSIVYRPRYEPYRRRHPQKYTGFMALYVHYLYLLGKAGQRQYPPKMTPHLRREIMKFESYKEQFAFLRAHGVSTAEGLQAVHTRTEETLASLMKQRTILNVRKKKRRALYDALSDAEALAPAKDCYESGMPGMEEPFTRYMDAVSTLERCGIPREQLLAEKAELYRQLADVNREIRQARKEISMCDTIERNRPQMEHDIQVAEATAKEVERDEYRRR